MEMENITATEVVIKTDGKDIVIKNPQVSKIRMQGQETFQISGEVIEQENIREEDVQLVMQKAGISKEEAEKLLKETGDIVLAIKKAKK